MSLISRQIALHKQKARTRFTSALQHLGENSIPGWFNALKFFMGESTSLSLKNQGQLSCKTLPRHLKDFLKDVQNNYYNETPDAREFIHTFLLELKRTYSSQAAYPTYFRKTIIENHAFTQKRMADIVQDFTRTLH